MNNWTKNLSKAELREHREKQIRNLQKAIEGMDTRWPELVKENGPEWADQWRDNWEAQTSVLSRELHMRLQHWRRGE